MNGPGTIVGFEVVQLEILEIAHQDVVGQFLRFQAGKVVNGLLVGLGQVPPKRLVFNEQCALPQQVNLALGGAQLVHALFEACYLAPGDAEHVKEGVPK